MNLNKLNLYEEPSLLEKAASLLIKAAGIALTLLVLYFLAVIFLSLGG